MENKKANMTDKVLRAAAFAAILLLALSCTSGETIVPTPEEETTTLQVGMTRASELESRLGKVRMVVFDIRQKCLINTTTPKSGVTFEEVVPAGYLDIHLIANELDEWDLDNVSSPSELRAKVLSFTVYPVVNDAHLIPMYGAYGVQAAANSITEINDNTYPLGTVERLYAKATLELSCDFATMGHAITLERIRIKNLPHSSFLAPNVYPGDTFFDGAIVVPTLADNGYDSSDPDGFSGVVAEFYIPEYLIREKAEYSYLSVTASLTSSPSVIREYKIPIGDGMATKNIDEMKGSGATLADLTITRNTHYTCIATITGFDAEEIEFSSKVVRWGEAEDVDLTKGNKQLEANSYMAEPGGDPILIPVSRANALFPQLNAADEYAVEMVWMEKWNGTTAVPAILSAASPLRTIRAAKTSTTDISKNYLLVTPGVAEGNAVVAIRKASTTTPNPNPILWSWHIWITRDMEQIEKGAGTGNAWMDRALGALPDYRGLYYQWGRRDAFPYSQAVTPDGTAATWVAAGKTIHDPCPPGWRVPSEAEFKTVIPAGDTGFIWTGSGREKAEAGGYYPAMGWMESGAVQGHNATGKYWHSSSVGVLSFDSGNIAYAIEAATSGCAVRCVKE